MTTTSAPVVLITGASSGLGRATAELLAASGMRVFGTSRAPRRDQPLPYTMLPLDVPIRSFAPHSLKEDL